MRQPSLKEELRPFGKRFTGAFFYFVFFTVLGTVVFRRIEGWSWLDSLYMSVTTLSSVGYMEVHPLSSTGRVFAMLLIGAGVTGLGIWWGLTTALIVELDLGGWLRRRRIMDKVTKLSKHYIVCGGGRMGRIVLSEMRRSGRPLVIIENNPERVANVDRALPRRPRHRG